MEIGLLDGIYGIALHVYWKYQKPTHTTLLRPTLEMPPPPFPAPNVF